MDKGEGNRNVCVVGDVWVTTVPSVDGAHIGNTQRETEQTSTKDAKQHPPKMLDHRFNTHLETTPNQCHTGGGAYRYRMSGSVSHIYFPEIKTTR